MIRFSNIRRGAFPFALFLLLLFSFPLFGDSKNIVYNKSFEASKIDKIEISLTYENLKISTIYGDEVVIEIGSNNINKIPQVSMEEDGLCHILKIISPNKRAQPGNNASLYLYLPQDFLPKDIKINLVNASLMAQALQAENSIKISGASGRLDIAAASTDFLEISSVSGNLTLQKLSVSYAQINTVSANIFVELEKNFEALSSIKSISGKIQLYYKKNESPFSDDSPKLILSSVSGKVESVPFD